MTGTLLAVDVLPTTDSPRAHRVFLDRGPGPATRLGHPWKGCARRSVLIVGPDDAPVAECVSCGTRRRVRLVSGPSVVERGSS